MSCRLSRSMLTPAQVITAEPDSEDEGEGMASDDDVSLFDFSGAGQKSKAEGASDARDEEDDRGSEDDEDSEDENAGDQVLEDDELLAGGEIKFDSW